MSPREQCGVGRHKEDCRRRARSADTAVTGRARCEPGSLAIPKAAAPISGRFPVFGRGQRSCGMWVGSAGSSAGTRPVAVPEASQPPRGVPWPVLGALVVLVVVSSVAHLWALRRDLPIPEIDESAFVRPAVRIAASGDPNPHWFGHPGSTVIYPLAGLFHAWDVLGHH